MKKLLLALLLFSTPAFAYNSPIIFNATCASGAYNVANQACLGVAGGGVSSVTGTPPIVSSGGANPAISIPVSTNSVDGYLSAADHTTYSASAALTAAATSANTASAIVKRDGSGNFSAGTITAALTGNAATASALFSAPSQCSPGSYATGITVAGNANCTVLPAINLTIGSFDGQPASANGAAISGNSLYMQSASATVPGLVNNTTQTLSGNKTLSGQTAISNATATALTVNTTSLVVDALNGAVGVGVIPSSLSVLDIVNSSGSTKAVQVTGYGSNVGFRGRYANGTSGSPTAALTGNILEFLSGRGYGATGFAAAATGTINITADGNFTDASMPTYISFNTTPSASVTNAERMRINSTGRILIGTTTDNGADILQVNGSANLLGTGGAGYLAVPAQSSAPSTPSSGFRLYADSANKLSWKGTNGFVRTFDGTANTADRAYILPDISGTIALGTNIASSGMVTVSSSPYALGTTEVMLFINTGSAITINLPNPNTNRQVMIKEISGTASTNQITLHRFAAEQIEGVAADRALTTDYGSWRLVSDGVNWWLL